MKKIVLILIALFLNIGLCLAQDDASAREKNLMANEAAARAQALAIFKTCEFRVFERRPVGEDVLRAEISKISGDCEIIKREMNPEKQIYRIEYRTRLDGNKYASNAWRNAKIVYYAKSGLIQIYDDNITLVKGTPFSCDYTTMRPRPADGSFKE
ncbi:MAG: hypothetical protein RR066_04740 [Mucinivorans sp.]